MYKMTDPSSSQISELYHFYYYDGYTDTVKGLFTVDERLAIEVLLYFLEKQSILPNINWSPPLSEIK